MPIPKAILTSLYEEQHRSMFEIAQRIGCSVHKVAYWMDQYHISRRNLSDANYHKYNPDGNPFLIKQSLTREESNLFHLAIGLFWGEGNKTVLTGVRIGNSEPALLKQWCKFLRQICQVKESKFTFIFKHSVTTTLYMPKSIGQKN